MSEIDIEKCKRCKNFHIGGEMGELNSNRHYAYPMCWEEHNKVIWNMNKCPKAKEQK